MEINKNNDRKRKNIGMHRLVAKAFLSNPNNLPVVNHKDGNGFNNDVSNLEWMTESQNSQHAHDTNLISIYTRPVLQYSKDGNFVNKFDSVKKAAKKMNCHSMTIIRVCQNKKGKKTAKGFVWKYENEVEELNDKDNEEWSLVWEHTDYYVSSCGRVYSDKTDRYLSPAIRKDGYMRVGMDQKHFYVHRLVAEFFIKQPIGLLKPVVNHKDGDKSNNHVSNLEWIEFTENIKHAHKTNLNKTCKPVIMYSLKGKELKRFDSVADAARVVKVSHTSILLACNKKEGVYTIKDRVWRFESEPLYLHELENIKPLKRRVIQYDANGEKIKVYSSLRKAARKVGVDSSSLTNACKGKINSSAGWVWRYEGDPPPSKSNKIGCVKKVAQCDANNGKVIKVWDSIAEAARELGINSPSHITAVCKERRKTTSGWGWKYV